MNGTTAAEAVRQQLAAQQQQQAAQQQATQVQQAMQQQQAVQSALAQAREEGRQQGRQEGSPGRIRIGATQRRPNRANGEGAPVNPAIAAARAEDARKEAEFQNRLAEFNKKVNRYNDLLLTINIASERNVQAVNSGRAIGDAMGGRGNSVRRRNYSGLSDQQALSISRELEVLRRDLLADPLLRPNYVEVGDPFNTDWPTAPRYMWRCFALKR